MPIALAERIKLGTRSTLSKLIPINLDAQPNGPKTQLDRNLCGDLKGLPGWYTHFGSESFAESGTDVFFPLLNDVYSKEKPLTVVSLGGGSAFYERVACRRLRREGWDPVLIVSELQLDSLHTIGPEDFPVVKLHVDSTKLPLPNGIKDVLVLSRAVEHYLPHATQLDLLAEAGRILDPEELYAAKITTGDPTALGALSAALKTIGGKEVNYLSLNDYRNNVDEVNQRERSPIFEEVCVGDAETQTERGASAQARRYLNEAFFNSHAASVRRLSRGKYRKEISSITEERDRLGHEVQAGNLSREEAIGYLDAKIQSTQVFDFFRKTYVDSIKAYLATLTPEEGRSLSGIHTSVGRDGNIDDFSIDVDYKVIVLRKLPSQDSVTRVDASLEEGATLRR